MRLNCSGSVSERASRIIAGFAVAVSLAIVVSVSPAHALEKIELNIAVVDVQLIMRQSKQQRISVRKSGASKGLREGFPATGGRGPQAERPWPSNRPYLRLKFFRHVFASTSRILPLYSGMGRVSSVS